MSLVTSGSGKVSAVVLLLVDGTWFAALIAALAAHTTFTTALALALIGWPAAWLKVEHHDLKILQHDLEVLQHDLKVLQHGLRFLRYFSAVLELDLRFLLVPKILQLDLMFLQFSLVVYGCNNNACFIYICKMNIIKYLVSSIITWFFNWIKRDSVNVS